MTSMESPDPDPTGRGLVPSFLAAFIVAAGLLIAPDAAPAQDKSSAPEYPAVQDPDLQTALVQIRQTTARYRDVEAALDAGYIRDPMNMCVTAPDEGLPAQMGEMGIHYFRPDLLKITEQKPRVNGKGTHTDFTEPGILVYEPQADGSMELVAVENLVFKEAWDETHEERPSFHGLDYFEMVDNPRTEADEAHAFRPHYELHLWVHRENPIAAFAQFNPNVTCEHHQATSSTAEDSGADRERRDR